MARYCGEVGYANSVKTRPGVYEDVITERKYYGDVLRNTRKSEKGTSINNDITVSNSINIVADAYAFEHFFNIKYVKWMGTRWTVSDVEVQTPRLTLRLGEVYNGPTPGTTGAPTIINGV